MLVSLAPFWTDVRETSTVSGCCLEARLAWCKPLTLPSDLCRKMVVIEHFVWSQMSFSQKKAHLLRQLEDAGWTGLQDKGAMKQVAL